MSQRETFAENINAANTHLSKDLILSEIIKQHKALDLPGAGNVFNELIKNIVYQQISYKAADAIYGRFLKLLHSELCAPTNILSLSHEQLRSVGLSNQKSNYIRNIAQHFQDHQLYNTNWAEWTDEKILDELIKIKGVGSWTVKMIMMFELQRTDILPHEDLAIRLVIKELYQLKEEKSALIKKIIEIAEFWRPYRSIASLYLWAYRRAQY